MVVLMPGQSHLCILGLRSGSGPVSDHLYGPDDPFWRRLHIVHGPGHVPDLILPVEIESHAEMPFLEFLEISCNLSIGRLCSYHVESNANTDQDTGN